MKPLIPARRRGIVYVQLISRLYNRPVEGCLPMFKVLVVEDDRDLRQLFARVLQRSGYETLEAGDGQQALEVLEKEDIHLVLLDVMMPQMDGLTALARVRQVSNVPVILLTAKSEDTDKILGLNVGADDYVTKPFNPVELLARVRSQLRRYLQLGGGQVRPSQIVIGSIALDDDAKAVTLDGEPVSLTPREYDILKLLMQNSGTVFAPKEIYRRIWGEEPYGAENAVAVHIRHLREKLEIDPANPRYLKVVWGKGYKLEEMKK